MGDLRRTPRRYGRLATACFDALRGASSRLFPGRAFYRWLLRRSLRLVEVDVVVPGLHRHLAGLRLVQISDLHAGPFLDERSLDPVVELVAACRPDVIAFTGDLITVTADDAEELGTFFERLPAALARVAVFGNHDYRGRQEPRLVRRLARAGFTCLRNESRLVTRGTARLRLVGLEDLEESKGSDLERALAGARSDDDLRILLCHHPDVVESLPSQSFALVLSGHTHGGQVVLPFARRRRLAGTFPLAGGGWLHINRGLGALLLPLRIGAPPEVTLLCLCAEDGP